MTPPKKPRSIEDATALLARHAALEGAIATHEADRQAAIATVDAAADMAVAPLVEEAEAIRAALEPWWKRAAPDLTKGKRKSVDLGGCTIGTRKGSDKLEFTGGDDKAALAAVLASPQKGAATSLKRILDKTKISAAIGGKSAAGTALKALGFRIAPGVDVFFVKRTDSPEAKVSAR